LPHYTDDKKALILEQLFDISIFISSDVQLLQKTLLFYISFLILRNDIKKSVNLLNEYISLYGIDGNLVRHLPIAHLAHINGITNGDVKFSSELFEKTLKYSEENILENYIKNKSIAIVGGGPHEVGTCNGEEIDSHDVVVRVNPRNIEEYAKDYGKKMNIVSLGMAKRDNALALLYSDDVLQEIDIVLLPQSLYIYSMAADLWNFLKNNRHFIIVTTDILLRADIQREYNLNYISSGFLTTYYFKKCLKANISKTDMFGFAVRSGIILTSHYYNDTLQINNHHLQMELKASQDIFSDDH
jgi:hypothetical protein